MLKIRKNRSIVIREKSNIKNSILDYTRYKELKWNGHVRRMNEESLLQNILDWPLTKRRRKGRPRNSWMQDVTTE